MTHTTVNEAELRDLISGANDGIDLGVSNHVFDRWLAADAEALRGAFSCLNKHGANVWVFAADVRHYLQFSNDADRAAMAALTREQYAALLGWADEDWED